MKESIIFFIVVVIIVLLFLKRKKTKKIYYIHNGEIVWIDATYISSTSTEDYYFKNGHIYKTDKDSKRIKEDAQIHSDKE